MIVIFCPQITCLNNLALNFFHFNGLWTLFVNQVKLSVKATHFFWFSEEFLSEGEAVGKHREFHTLQNCGEEAVEVSSSQD